MIKNEMKLEELKILSEVNIEYSDEFRSKLP
jgi:hypothetical protein